MKKIVVKEEKRLDEIVYGYCKTLDVFDRVLEINPHLVNKMFLHSGDVVYLPDVDNSVKIKEVKTLW